MATVRAEDAKREDQAEEAGDGDGAKPGSWAYLWVLQAMYDSYKAAADAHGEEVAAPLKANWERAKAEHKEAQPLGVRVLQAQRRMEEQDKLEEMYRKILEWSPRTNPWTKQP